jgi:organic hydroperoxide reductase OsmC/OhrA
VTRTHHYGAAIRWTGNRGTGTSSYHAYDRTHEISSPGKPIIAASADLAFRGETERWNPEELLVVSLSQCHLLWYLHLAATAGVVVTNYFIARSVSFPVRHQPTTRVAF